MRMGNPWIVSLLSLLALRYLSWRVTATLNLTTPLAATLSLAAVGAELLLLTGFQLQLIFSLWPAPAEREDESAPHRPTVDVLVPSYGEPPELIERCLRGCLAMDYPSHTVWLLDDSHRAELHQLCRALGVRYLARETREHAKAGNLNHALRHCQGELVAVFDADVVPLNDFLRQTVPLFSDPATGFVQTPQSYMNADPVMRNLGLERWLMPDEECFYRWIQPSREAVGAVVCAGTSFVMRREALDRVGGFETGTPAEDLATGIRITAAGYRNRYLSTKLSAGLAPFTVEAMATQRCRWASGTVQVLRTGANPLRIAGLHPLQRLAYLEGILHWFSVIPQLMLVLLPLATGLLGIAPVQVKGEGLLAYALPFYGAQLLLARWLTRQSRTAVLPELYRWIFLVPLSQAVLLTLLGRPRRFRVTPKNQPAAGERGMAWSLLLPLLLLFLLQLLGLIGLVSPPRSLERMPLSTATVMLNLGWICSTLLLLALAMQACLQRMNPSTVPWFRQRLACRLRCWDGPTPETVGPVMLEAISEAGVELLLKGPAAALWGAQPSGRRDPLREDRRLELQLPESPWLPLRIEAMGRQPRRLRIGASWQTLDGRQQDQLQAWLYRRPRLWPQQRAPLEPLALIVVISRLLRGCAPEGWFQRSLIPQAPPTLTPDGFQGEASQA